MSGKKRKPAVYMPPKLSKKDEGVPQGYISMYQLFVVSKDIKEKFGSAVATDLRKKTYRNVLKLFNEYGSIDYDKFWNLHINEITELKLNEFAKYEELVPICRYIECFSKKAKDCDEISFGINIDLLKRYYTERDRCAETGEEFVPPQLVRKGRQPKKDLVVFGRMYFPTSDTTETTVERNATYRRFAHWCDLQNLTKREACLMAMEAVVEMNPIDGVENIGAYERTTVFDELYLAKKKRGLRKKITIELEGNIYETAMSIIRRYNADPVNQNASEISISTYANNAVNLLNGKMDLKYSNPKLLKEKQEIEEYKKYIEESEG